MMIKIGVLSDTHLHRVTDDLKSIYDRYLRDKDYILHTGDYVSHEVVDYLDHGNFHGVSGNMDSVEVKDRLPWKTVVTFGTFRIGLIHGWGSSSGLEETIRSEFEGVDAIVYGHSHRARNQVRNGLLMFNPGTAIGYSSKGEHTIGVLAIDDRIEGKIIRI